MKQEREHFDITGYSFEQFVAFLFQHDVTLAMLREDASGKDSWYSQIEVEFDPIQLSEHYLRLFRAPEFLRDRYTMPQMEEGFWAIQSCAVDCSVECLLRSDELPFLAKERCVRSMYDLFARLFAYEPLESAVQMWWDSLCFGWTSGTRMGKSGRENSDDRRFFELMTKSNSRTEEEWAHIRRFSDEDRKKHEPEDMQLQQVIFETLSQILALPFEHCQYAALHGLGHLHHPGTPKLVDEFLANHPELSEEEKNYALTAAKFDIL
jgi:hypothetical protein